MKISDHFRNLGEMEQIKRWCYIMNLEDVCSLEKGLGKSKGSSDSSKLEAHNKCIGKRKQ